MRWWRRIWTGRTVELAEDKSQRPSALSITITQASPEDIDWSQIAYAHVSAVPNGCPTCTARARLRIAGTYRATRAFEPPFTDCTSSDVCSCLLDYVFNFHIEQDCGPAAVPALQDAFERAGGVMAEDDLEAVLRPFRVQHAQKEAARRAERDAEHRASELTAKAWQAEKRRPGQAERIYRELLAGTHARAFHVNRFSLLLERQRRWQDALDVALRIHDFPGARETEQVMKRIERLENRLTARANLRPKADT